MNDKGADQTAPLRRLVWAFVVHMQQSGFLASRPIGFECHFVACFRLKAGFFVTEVILLHHQMLFRCYLHVFVITATSFHAKFYSKILYCIFSKILNTSCLPKWPRQAVQSHIIWASMRENLSSGVCEQQRRRPACASAQSDQRLCYSLFEKYHI